MDEYFIGLIIGGAIFLAYGFVVSISYLSLIGLAAIAAGVIGLLLENYLKPNSKKR